MARSELARGSRWFLWVAVVLCIAAVSGCGEEAAKTPPPGPAQPPAQAEDTLARIKREGVLRWGADAEGGAPFVYRDPKDVNKIVGFEMDIMEKLGGHLGVKLERVQGDWGSPLIDNCKAGRTDLVMNGYEINDEHKVVVAFSDPYFAYEQQLTVRAEDKDKYKTLADLKGKKIAVLNDTEAERLLGREGFGADLIGRYPDSSSPYDELDLKRVEAVLQESIIATYYAGPRPALYNIPQTFSPGQYGVIMRKDDASLLKEINRILALMKQNGELGAIYKTWGILDDKQKSVGVIVK